MRDGVLARERLDDLGRALGSPDAPRSVIEGLYSGKDPFEIGVAATFAHGAPARALVYYNPRQRHAAFLGRVRRVMDRHRLARGWLRDVAETVPLSQLSVIAGFDVDERGVPGGTLYFEELHERLGDGAQRVARSLGAKLGLGDVAWDERVGHPYILAVDFSAAGAERLKLYHLASPSDRSAARDEAATVTTALSDPQSDVGDMLFGEGPCSGYIIQRAFERGALVRHKVYRCFPYETEPTGDVALRALETLGLGASAREGVGAAVLDPRFGTTSVGAAFLPGSSTLEYVSVYQSLLRGD